MTRSQYRVCIAFILGYYSIKLIYYATRIAYGIPPDETMHVGLADQYIGNWNFFLDTSSYIADRIIISAQDRFFYHFMMGKLFVLSPISDHVLFYRLINIFISFSSIYYFLRLLCLFNISKVLRLFALICYTNILMFTVLSASVTYDVLIIFFANGFFYHFFNFLNNKNLDDIIIIVIYTSLGCLTKPSFVPFVPLIILLLGISYRAKIRLSRIQEIKAFFSNTKRQLLLSICLISIIATSISMISNKIAYGKYFNIACSDIYSSEECYSCNGIVRSYVDLKNSNRENPRVNFASYLDTWTDLIIKRSFGIYSHAKLELSDSVFTIAKGLFYLPFILFMLTGITKSSRLPLFLTFYYFFIIVFYVNYRSYLSQGSEDAAVHGRYLFPVFGLYLLVIVNQINGLSMRKRYLYPILSIISFVLVMIEFPNYLRSEGRFNFEQRLQVLKYADSPEFLTSTGSVFNIDSYNDIAISPDMTILYIGDRDRNDDEYHSVKIPDIVIKGWAYDGLENNRAGEILFAVNNSAVFKALRHERPDVANHFNNVKLLNSGFTIKVYDLEEGQSEIKIFIKPIGEAGLLGDYKTLLIQK